MAKYRKKPIVIEATQWFKNGDHPDDSCPSYASNSGETVVQGEGRIVRYFRHPGVPDDRCCPFCGLTMHNHGWIDTKEGGFIVCPGDWIITGVQGERYPCKPDIFAATYEPANVNSAAPAPPAGETERPDYDSGLCCMADHANATPPWTCSCPCHTRNQEPEAGETARERIAERIVVTCHCGREMLPIIDGPDEVLYMCSDDACPQQVNVMTRERSAALRADSGEEK